jgi:serine/threonine-protein kinase
MLIKAGTAQARPLTSIAPTVPPPIAAVVDRALKFDKAERWPSAAAMRDALREAYRAAFGVPLDRSALAGLFDGESTASTDRHPTPDPHSPHAHEPTMLAQGTPATQPMPASVVNTAEPVSSGPTPTPTLRRGKSPLFAGIAGIALVVTGIVALVVVMQHQRSSAAPSATTASIVTNATAPAASAVVIAPDPTAIASPPPSTATTTTTTTSTQPSAHVQQPASSSTPTAHATSKPVASASASAKPNDDCNPSYYFDSEGNRHFKVQCFH